MDQASVGCPPGRAWRTRSAPKAARVEAGEDLPDTAPRFPGVAEDLPSACPGAVCAWSPPVFGFQLPEVCVQVADFQANRGFFAHAVLVAIAQLPQARGVRCALHERNLERRRCANERFCTETPLNVVYGVATCVNLLQNRKQWQLISATGGPMVLGYARVSKGKE